MSLTLEMQGSHATHRGVHWNVVLFGQGCVSLFLPKPPSDQFPVRVCVCAFCI